MEKLDYKQTLYYSGQGIVYAGERLADQTIGRIVPLGNVPKLRIEMNCEYYEAKMSRGGILLARTPNVVKVDARFTATLESISNVNLAWAMDLILHKDAVAAAGNYSFRAYAGKSMDIGRTLGAISNVKAGSGVVSLTPYVNSKTAWDYKYNYETGLIVLNDGVIAPHANLKAAFSDWLAVSSFVAIDSKTCRITVPFTTHLEEGGRVTLRDTKGTLEGSRETYVATVVGWDQTTVDILYPPDSIPTGTVSALFDGFTVTYTAQQAVNLDKLGGYRGQTETFLRFAGVNLADSGNPVVLDIPRAVIKPVGGLELMSETVTSLDIEGIILPVGSGKNALFEWRYLSNIASSAGAAVGAYSPAGTTSGVDGAGDTSGGEGGVSGGGSASGSTDVAAGSIPGGNVAGSTKTYSESPGAGGNAAGKLPPVEIFQSGYVWNSQSTVYDFTRYPTPQAALDAASASLNGNLGAFLPMNPTQEASANVTTVRDGLLVGVSAQVGYATNNTNYMVRVQWDAPVGWYIAKVIGGITGVTKARVFIIPVGTVLSDWE